MYTESQAAVLRPVFCQNTTKGRFFIMAMNARTSRPMTAEQRERHNAYMRQYRAEHPEKTREWRDRYIMRRAEKLQALQAEQGAAAE